MYFQNIIPIPIRYQFPIHVGYLMFLMNGFQCSCVKYMDNCILICFMQSFVIYCVMLAVGLLLMQWVHGLAKHMRPALYLQLPLVFWNGRL